MQWIKTSDTTYKCPICYAEISVEAGEEMPGYCKHCETEFDEETSIDSKAHKYLVNEIKCLKYAPRLNGCEMTPEWAETLEINEYLLKLVKEKQGNA